MHPGSKVLNWNLSSPGLFTSCSKLLVPYPAASLLLHKSQKYPCFLLIPYTFLWDVLHCLFWGSVLNERLWLAWAQPYQGSKYFRHRATSSPPLDQALGHGKAFGYSKYKMLTMCTVSINCSSPWLLQAETTSPQSSAIQNKPVLSFPIAGVFLSHITWPICPRLSVHASVVSSFLITPVKSIPKLCRSWQSLQSHL